MGLEVEKLRRLSSMARSAADVDGVLDGTHAPALTSTYARIRQQIVDGLEGDLSDEFQDNFPELAIVQPPSPHPRVVAMFPARYAAAASEAATLLRQMSGWLDGLILSETSSDD